MTFRIRRLDGSILYLPVETPAQGFAYADMIGARRLWDQYDALYVKMEGEWYEV